MRTASITASVLLTVLALGAAPAPAANPVGFIRNAQGAGVVRRADADLPAREGLALIEGDVVRTAADGQVGVLFHDDTRVGLGPDSEVTIVSFQFEPRRDHLAFVLRITRGVVSYVSGKIGALSPGRIRIETPVGIVGVRGTAFAIRIEGP